MPDYSTWPTEALKERLKVISLSDLEREAICKVLKDREPPTGLDFGLAQILGVFAIPAIFLAYFILPGVLIRKFPSFDKPIVIFSTLLPYSCLGIGPVPWTSDISMGET